MLCAPPLHRRSGNGSNGSSTNPNSDLNYNSSSSSQLPPLLIQGQQAISRLLDGFNVFKASASQDEAALPPPPNTSGLTTPPPSSSLKKKVDDRFGKLLYSYYNWRQDAGSDLTLLMSIFFGVLLINSVLRSVVVAGSTPEDLSMLWSGFYEVMELTFGQVVGEN